MSKLLSVIFFAILSGTTLAGQLPDPKYAPVRADSWVQNSNFYLLTLLEKLPGMNQIIAGDELFSKITNAKKESLKSALKSCGEDYHCYLNNIKFSQEEIQKIGQRLAELGSTQKEFGQLIQNHLLPSGRYILFAGLQPGEMLKKAWEQDAGAINYVIDVYGGGKAPNSPAIDSISFDVKNDIFPKIIYTCTYLNLAEVKDNPLFFKSSMNFALHLIEFNDRNRIADFEPMETNCNKLACDRVGSVKWQDYPYSLILVPGQGPEIEGEPLSAIGMIRCRIAACRWREGLAPFIMVSGGRVHPYKTKFAEAEEMKKYLIETLHIPENAIFMEPHARHTTTNIRNCNRLIFKYGIPFDKPCLASSDKFQSAYISSQNMQERCQKELGYSPYRNGKRISETESEFYPEIASLQIDADEPMDP
jgi:hypothetical protein